jgi:competence protein ComEA
LRSSFPRSEPRFWAAAAIVFALIVYAGVMLIPPRRPPPQEPRAIDVDGEVVPLTIRLPGKLDLNQATPEELEELPGIGPVLAARIVTYREEHGPFTSVEGLLEVPGIGEALLEKLKPLVEVSSP